MLLGLPGLISSSDNKGQTGGHRNRSMRRTGLGTREIRKFSVSSGCCNKMLQIVWQCTGYTVYNSNVKNNTVFPPWLEAGEGQGQCSVWWEGQFSGP